MAATSGAWGAAAVTEGATEAGGGGEGARLGADSSWASTCGVALLLSTSFSRSSTPIFSTSLVMLALRTSTSSRTASRRCDLTRSCRAQTQHHRSPSTRHTTRSIITLPLRMFASRSPHQLTRSNRGRGAIRMFLIRDTGRQRDRSYRNVAVAHRRVS